MPDPTYNELQRLHVAASPTPWTTEIEIRAWEESGEGYAQLEWGLIPDNAEGYALAGIEDGEMNQTRANVEFAAAAVNAVSGLLAERDALIAAARELLGILGVHKNVYVVWQMRNWVAPQLSVLRALLPDVEPDQAEAGAQAPQKGRDIEVPVPPGTEVAVYLAGHAPTHETTEPLAVGTVDDAIHEYDGPDRWVRLVVQIPEAEYEHLLDTEVAIYPAGHAPTGVTREALRDAINEVSDQRWADGDEYIAALVSCVWSLIHPTPSDQTKEGT